MDTDAATSRLATQYFETLIWGAPAYLATFALSGWFLGLQNSRITMWVSILINVTNITASLILVYIFHAGITGIATGTLIAQWVGFITLLLLAMRRTRLRASSWHEAIDLPLLRRFFRINTDIFLRTLCLVAVTIWFTRMGARQGDAMLAANALLMQFFTLFSFFMDGFAFAGEALTGRFIGANDRAMLHRTVRTLLAIGVVMGIIFSAVYLFCGDTLLQLLSSDATVTALAHVYLPWAAALPLTGFLAFTYDGIFIGATATRKMLLSMSLAAVVFFIVQAIVFPILANNGLWLAFICYLLTRGIALAASRY
jgi:MATE family multidrug resistance protein